MDTFNFTLGKAAKYSVMKRCYSIRSRMLATRPHDAPNRFKLCGIILWSLSVKISQSRPSLLITARIGRMGKVLFLIGVYLARPGGGVLQSQVFSGVYPSPRFLSQVFAPRFFLEVSKSQVLSQVLFWEVPQLQPGGTPVLAGGTPGEGYLPSQD